MPLIVRANRRKLFDRRTRLRPRIWYIEIRLPDDIGGGKRG